MPRDARVPSAALLAPVLLLPALFVPAPALADGEDATGHPPLQALTWSETSRPS
ncbi:hypothetical protein [Nocardiopsis sp. CNT312]|uniref:hypothetical protein n=1 Tax=Nocardiopsis sp. CNT312 TaxID=1137268 RepID=UPI0018CC2192|nr:hypothetical protein [Nocardiopsis sp. CNT312]